MVLISLTHLAALIWTVLGMKKNISSFLHGKIEVAEKSGSWLSGHNRLSTILLLPYAGVDQIQQQLQLQLLVKLRAAKFAQILQECFHLIQACN